MAFILNQEVSTLQLLEKHQAETINTEMANNENMKTLEFLGRLKELKEKIVEVQQQVRQVKEKIPNRSLNTSKGISLLDVKHHTLLQYITNLVFLIHLRLDGKSIAGHPVIMNLVELRVVLEKIRPIEQKLKYQIDKLIKAASFNTESDNVENRGNLRLLEHTMADPLGFKPNPENLVSKIDDEIEGGGGQQTQTGLYKAPRLAPVHFDEGQGKHSKRDKEQLRALTRASRSRLMKDIMAEYDDHPEEIDAAGGVHEGIGRGMGMDEQMIERNRYEEENFVRLTLSKKELNKMKRGGVKGIENEFENLKDFQSFADLQDSDMEETKIFAKNDGRPANIQSFRNMGLGDEVGEGKKRKTKSQRTKRNMKILKRR
ncbi:hypothetical protein G9A89_023508 [Geosiphon pyriformis]|nr:hypothetical protein G9A89_023508 [Geosiphon pyriformis]